MHYDLKTIKREYELAKVLLDEKRDFEYYVEQEYMKVYDKNSKLIGWAKK